MAKKNSHPTKRNWDIYAKFIVNPSYKTHALHGTATHLSTVKWQYIPHN